MGSLLRIITLLTLVVVLSVATSLAATESVTSFSPSASAFGSSGGAGAISVTSSAAWTAHTDDSWITITSPTSFSSDGSISYTVSSNQTGFDRTGSIELGREMFIVRQAKTDLTDNVDPSSWSQQYINAIYAAGITVGCGNNSFCKADPVTREQMAAFLIRAVVGENFSYSQTPYFGDVPTTGWSYKYVQKLKDLGLTASTGTYNSTATVTREQMAAFLVRAKFGENFSYPTTPYFSDVPDTSWSFKYVQKLKELGYTSVTGNYGAADPITREQMAAFLSRVFLGTTSRYDVTSSKTGTMAGTYQGTALIQTNTGKNPVTLFTIRIDGSGTVTGVATDLTDGNMGYAFGGTANEGAGTVMFGYTMNDGTHITFSGAPASGTWSTNGTQNAPPASGTYSTIQAPPTSQGGFTSALISGRTFNFKATDKYGTVTGTMAFHSDGTVLGLSKTGTDIGLWSIDSLGHLVMETEDGDQLDVFTIIDTTGTSIMASYVETEDNGRQIPGVVTFTP